MPVRPKRDLLGDQMPENAEVRIIASALTGRNQRFVGRHDR